jgi:hypothetical protein
MSPSELASKIAEEVFRTIEREKAIIKAEIVDAVEKVVLQWQAAERVARDAELLSSSPVFRAEHPIRYPDDPPKPGEWKQISRRAFDAAMKAAAYRDCGATRAHEANNPPKLGEWEIISKEELEAMQAASWNRMFQQQSICAFPNCLCSPHKVCHSARPQERQA